MPTPNPRLPTSSVSSHARKDVIEDLAADWLARRDAGFSAAESRQFDRWLADDERHVTAVAALEAAWTIVNQPRRAGQQQSMLRELAGREDLRRRRRQRRVTFLSLTMAAAAALVFAFIFPRATPSSAAPTVSIAMRPERQTLTDGSVIELNAQAEIAVEFTPTQRSVRLLRGEAHFTVTKDPNRPFVVFAGRIETRAVGTAFAVRYAASEVAVLVTEGKVAVSPTPAPTEIADASQTSPVEPVFVSAGAQVTLPVDGSRAREPRVEEVNATAIASALAWRDKRVEFSGTPLTEAVALFNRQNDLQLFLRDRSLGGLRVSGIFWSDDPAGFARLLEASFGVTAEHRSGREIALRRAP